jgi:hypothetical protein
MSSTSGPEAAPSNVDAFARSVSPYGRKGKKSQLVYYQSGVGSGELGPIQHIIAGICIVSRDMRYIY